MESYNVIELLFEYLGFGYCRIVFAVNVGEILFHQVNSSSDEKNE